MVRVISCFGFRVASWIVHATLNAEALDRKRFRELRQRADLLKQAGSLNYLIGARSHPIILREIHPAHGPRRIDEKLSRPRDIMTVNPRPSMNQVITPNGVRVRIGEKRECVTNFRKHVAIRFGVVNTNRHGTNADRIELLKILLNAPQLGVTRRSPVASIENQKRSLRSFAINRRR